MIKITLKVLGLVTGHSGLISRGLYDLTPAPPLSRQLPASGYRHHYIVFRDSQDVTDAVELKDAIRTQDADANRVSLPYRSPFYGNFAPPPKPSSRSKSREDYVRKFELDYLESLVTGSQKRFHPYKYSVHRVPECAVTNKHFYNISFCLEDPYYPVATIKYELDRNREMISRLLSDISFQSADNLVDGLTRVEEEHYRQTQFSGYKQEEGGYVCPSDIFYGRPQRAVNTWGHWKVIVNLPDRYGAQSKYGKYTQTTRLEQCVHPGTPCSYLSPSLPSSCLQKHNFVRLLAYTFDEGLHIDSFKLPVACSCHISPVYGAHNNRPEAPVTPVYQPPPSVTLGPVFTTSSPQTVPGHSTPAPGIPGPTHLPPLISTPLYQPSPNPYRVNVG